MFRLIVAFHCCSPSIHDDVHEFWATFGQVERGGVFYIPLITLKFVYSVCASQHCVALVLGATQTKKNQFSHEKNRALDTIQREYILYIIIVALYQHIVC